MTQITNLNRFRKQKAREQARQQGDENAAKFGRTAAQRRREQDDRDRAETHLDQHQRDD
ncbi:DUF4169 family protein [Paracoccus sp. (in: a-proteobacteria)]|uniref:DUF4169 family protein n=1 Tax=Paracoccus sp. TaxID=267 RepID=UPI0026E0B5FF|nr:DUF4169 family protein [Paracoccus sp. (in: a-proteobacteria)]MDO5646618.1 DUF4169 family protein [Paracoccus sp. (in: a-proteobacteria)]